MHQHKSEIARFREQQALEEEAARLGLYGLAMVASHDMITARMERAGERILRLIDEGKEDEAVKLMNTEWWEEQAEDGGCQRSMPGQGGAKVSETDEGRPRGWGRLGLRHGAEFWGEDDTIRVHMSYVTFRRHVRAYLEEKGIVSPTAVEVNQAACDLQWVAQWHACDDVEVEIVRKVSGGVHNCKKP